MAGGEVTSAAGSSCPHGNARQRCFRVSLSDVSEIVEAIVWSADVDASGANVNPPLVSLLLRTLTFAQLNSEALST